MTQLLVTIDNHSLLPKIRQAIKLLNGVSEVADYQASTIDTFSKSNDVSISDLQSLVGVITINEKDVEDDERLQYLLNK